MKRIICFCEYYCMRFLLDFYLYLLNFYFFASLDKSEGYYVEYSSLFAYNVFFMLAVY